MMEGDQKYRCFLCGKWAPTEVHHIYSGTANRKMSEKYGMVVHLCHECHNEPPNGVHFNKKRMDYLRKLGQIEFEKTHTREEFMRIFGKNYIED